MSGRERSSAADSHPCARLSELDAQARDVLAEDRVRNHKLFWQGVDMSSRNLERLYHLTIGTELEARVKKLEDELTTTNRSDGDDST